MDPIQLKLLLEALKKEDTRKASDILNGAANATEYDKGYKKALSGIVAAVENKEANSLFLRMMSGAVTKKILEEQRRQSREISRETFRPASERGYEKAWYDILSIFLGKKKVGLEKHVEGELY